MRTRLAVLFALVLVLSAVPAGVALAAPHVWAQDGAGGGDPTGPGDEAEGGETDSSGESEEDGASDPAAETGAGEDSEEGAAATGPPWTYQMAWLGLGLLVLIAGAIALAYRKLVVQRQRAGI